VRPGYYFFQVVNLFQYIKVNDIFLLLFSSGQIFH
jgi:hypothetical protein